MLNESQKSQARHEGGKPIADKKAHLARAATAMRKVIGDPSGLTLGDVTAMHNALKVMDKVIAKLDQDARAANAIKKDHERRFKEALEALDHLPSIAIDDIVALASIAGELSDLKALAAGRYAGVETQWALRDVIRSALSWLAYKVARDQLDPAAYRESVRGEMQAHKDRHAELIQKLNTLAVAEQMEKSK